MNLEAMVRFGNEKIPNIKDTTSSNFAFSKLKNMKRIVLFLLLISAKINAQEHFNWGLKEGISRSQVSGITYKGFYKSGFTGGAFIKGRLAGNWTAAIDVMYVECGSLRRSVYTKGHVNSYFLQLNYIQIPLLFQYHIARVGLEFGPGYGILMKIKEINVIDGISYSGTQPFNQDEINFNFGVTYSFSSRFGYCLRYTNSIVPIRRNSFETDKWFQNGQKNNVFILCLTYEFGSEGSVWK